MITTTFSNHILNKLFAQSTTEPAWPKNYCYLGLSTTEPTATGANFSEPSPTIEDTSTASGYKRINIEPFMAAASNQSITNDTEIHFLEAQNDWGLIKYFGIFAAASGATAPVFWGAINEEEDGTVIGANVSTGSVAIIPAGQLTVTLT